MASVLGLQRHYRRPSGDASVNWSHPLAHGLIACVLGGLPRNIVTGKAVSLATGTAGAPGQEGLLLTGSTGRYETNSARQVGSALSLFGVVTPQGSGARMAFAYGNEASGQAAIRVKSNSSSNWGLHGWGIDYDSSTPVVSGRRVAVGATLPASGNLGLYLNGQNILSNTTFSYSGVTFVLAIGAGPDISLEPWNGIVELAAAWDRALSPTEQQWLAIEPYALLEAPRRWWGARLAGGATYNETISLSTHASTTSTSLATLTGAVALSAQGTCTDTGLQQLQAAASFAAAAGMTATGLGEMTEAVALTARATFAPATVAAVLGTVGLAGTVTLSPSGLLVLDLAQTLATTANIALQDELGAGVHTEVLALAARAVLATSERLIADRLIALAGAAGISSAFQQTLGGQIALQLRGDIAAVGQQVTAGAIALGATASQAQSAAAALQASLTLGIAALLTAAGQVSTAPILAALTFASEALTAGVTFTEEHLLAGVHFTAESIEPE